MALSLAALVVALGAGGPRPEVAIGANALVADRAAQLDAELTALEEQLAPAVDAARHGAARVVDGDADPVPELESAADLVVGAAEPATAARRATARLEAALRARSPDAASLPLAPDPAALTSIGGQLGSAADAATTFVDARRRAADVAAALDGALAALSRGDEAEAASAVARARADHDAVAAWEIGSVTLPVWVSTTDAMIGAVERIVDASRRGDAAAAEAAAAEFAALADDGVTADRALRIAIAEAGSAVTAAPLERLASVLSAVDDLRASIAPMLAEPAR